MSLTIAPRPADATATARVDAAEADSGQPPAPSGPPARRVPARRPWGMRLADHHRADTATARHTTATGKTTAGSNQTQARFDPRRQIAVTGDGTPIAHTDSRLTQVTTKLPGDPHDWQDPAVSSTRTLREAIPVTALTLAPTAAHTCTTRTVGTVSRPWGMRLCTPPTGEAALDGVRYDPARQVSLTTTGEPAAGTEIMNLITSLSGGTTGGDDIGVEDTPPSYPPDEAHPAPATLLSSTGGAEGAVFDPHRQVTVGADGTPLARTGVLADRTSKYLKGADGDQPDAHEPGPLEVPITIPTAGSVAIEVRGGSAR